MPQRSVGPKLSGAGRFANLTTVVYQFAARDLAQGDWAPVQGSGAGHRLTD